MNKNNKYHSFLFKIQNGLHSLVCTRLCTLTEPVSSPQADLLLFVLLTADVQTQNVLFFLSSLFSQSVCHVKTETGSLALMFTSTVDRRMLHQAEVMTWRIYRA